MSGFCFLHRSTVYIDTTHTRARALTNKHTPSLSLCIHLQTYPTTPSGDVVNVTEHMVKKYATSSSKYLVSLWEGRGKHFAAAGRVQ